jgi:hypothetical protein
MITAAELTQVLDGRWNGQYGMARCVVHEDHRPSLSIMEGNHGPIVTCFAGCDWRDLRAELRRRGLIDDAPRILSPGTRKAIIGDSVILRHDRQRKQQRDKAGWLWSRRRCIEGTPAERYLRDVRCYSRAIPKTLAFLPPSKPAHYPALIAPYSLVDEPEPGVLGVAHNVSAVHLTLLHRDGTGKADIAPNKLTVGQPCGRPIVIAPANDLLGIAITEGTEDALSVYEATGLGAWAAGCAPYMPALAPMVPGYIEAVTIYAHDDGGRRFAEALAAALDLCGIEIRIEGLAQ